MSIPSFVSGIIVGFSFGVIIAVVTIIRVVYFPLHSALTKREKRGIRQ